MLISWKTGAMDVRGLWPEMMHAWHLLYHQVAAGWARFSRPMPG